jgi:hypothetical protein
VRVTGQIAYGLTSPLAGVMEFNKVAVALPAKNDLGLGLRNVATAQSSTEYWS